MFYNIAQYPSRAQATSFIILIIFAEDTSIANIEQTLYLIVHQCFIILGPILVPSKQPVLLL